MSDASAITLYVFSCMGMTILVVWPDGGPGGWIRDRMLRRMLPTDLGSVLDCYICFSVWIALAATPFWWAEGYHWSVVAWLVVPTAFWLVLPESRSGK